MVAPMPAADVTLDHPSPEVTEQPFYVMGGALPPEAPSYVTRRADDVLYRALARGEFCYVLDTRQVGKSSLLVRTARRLQRDGATVAAFDLSALGHNLSVEQWFAGLLYGLADQIGAWDEIEGFWDRHPSLGPAQRWFQAVAETLRERPDLHLVLLFDEIDAVRRLPFSSDEFFAGIRGGYERRSFDPALKRLTVCLAGAATPTQLIADVRSTPFNVGTRIELNDFTEEEAAPLMAAIRSGSRENGRRLLRRVLYWTGGQPYLTQCLCAAAAARSVERPGGVDRVCAALFLTRQAREGDKNLTFVADRMLRGDEDRAAVLTLYNRLLRSRSGVRFDPTDPAATALHLSGAAVVRDDRLTVRNRLYRRLFDRRWVAESLPDAERRRQRQASRAGFLRATMIWGALSAAILAVLWQTRNARTAQARAAAATTHARQVDAEKEKLSRQTAGERRKLASAKSAVASVRDQLGRVSQAEERARASLRSMQRTRQKTLKSLATAQRQRQDALVALHNAEQKTTAEETRARTLEEDIARKNGIVASALTSRRGNEFDALEFGIRAVEPAVQRGAEPAPENLQGLADAVNAGIFRRLRIEHPYPLTCIDASPDGTKLLTAGKGPLAFIRDASDGRLLQTLQVHAGKRPDLAVDAARFSPDGKWIATGTADGTISLWRTDQPGRHQATPARVLKMDFVPTCALAFFPDSRHLVSAAPEGTARIWDIETGQYREIGGEYRETGTKYRKYLWSVAVSDDGKNVATAGNDGFIRVWDAATGKMLKENADFTKPLVTYRMDSTQSHGALCVRFTNAGCLLCTGKDLIAFTWVWRTGTYNRFYHRHVGMIWSGDIHGNCAATGSEDRTVCVWNIGRSRFPLFQLETNAGSVNEVRFVPGRFEIATASGDGTAEVWRVTPCIFFNSGTEMRYSEYSPDGKSFVSVGGEGVIDIRTPDDRVRFTIFQTEGNRGAFRAAFSPDGRTLAVTDNWGCVRIWDLSRPSRILTSQDCREVFRHVGAAFSVAYTRDGRSLISAGWDGKIWIGDAATGATRRTLQHSAAIYDAHPSPDGRYVAGVDRFGVAMVWDIESRQRLCVLDAPERRLVGKPPECRMWTEFSPDGRYLAVACSSRVAYLWDWRRKEIVAELAGHEGAVDCISFSPDGRRLAAAGQDNAVRFWSVEDALAAHRAGRAAKPYLSIHTHVEGVESVRFAPNGEQVVTASQDGTTRFFPATPKAYLASAHELLAMRTVPPASNDEAVWRGEQKEAGAYVTR